MSSGFFGFFAHTGFMLALEEAGYSPRRVTGSSAGALVGACWAAGIDLEESMDELLQLRREDFWDPRPGLGLLRGKLFRSRLESILPVETFAQCHVPIAMSVFDIARRSTAVLSEGDLAASVHASCAVPALFHPAQVAGRWYWDGGIYDRPGLLGARTGQRILFHHLASKSPWRSRGGRTMEIPRADNLVALAIEGLPRVNPFRLERGADALAMARERTRRALQRPIVEGVVRVS